KQADGAALRRGVRPLCRAARRARAELSVAAPHGGRAVSRRRAERRGRADRDRADGKNPRPIHGHRKCRRRRRHDRERARGGGAGGTMGGGGVAAGAAGASPCPGGGLAPHVAARVPTPNEKYDPERVFDPIGFTAHAPAVIVARKDFPAKDLREFLAYLQK